jgi:hypothetical protein
VSPGFSGVTLGSNINLTLFGLPITVPKAGTLTNLAVQFTVIVAIILAPATVITGLMLEVLYLLL